MREARFSASYWLPRPLPLPLLLSTVPTSASAYTSAAVSAFHAVGIERPVYESSFVLLVVITRTSHLDPKIRYAETQVVSVTEPFLFSYLSLSLFHSLAELCNDPSNWNFNMKRK